MNDFVKTGTYYGAARYEGEFEGHHAIVCLPENRKENAPFVWRCEFFGAFDKTDGEMIRRGYPVAAYSISDLFGCDESIVKMKRFYDFVTKEFSIGPRAFLFGFSRGGLYAANYAYYHPSDTAALYLDAPVLTLSAWPFGYGSGCGSETDTALAYAVFGLDRESARSFSENPIDRVGKLIEDQIPVVMVAGLCDVVVPYAESGALLERAYRAAAAPIEVFLKHDCDHHPHGLEDPTPVCDVLEEWAAAN